MNFHLLLAAMHVFITTKCHAGDIPSTLVTILNEMSRTLARYTNRQDFNQWLESQRLHPHTKSEETYDFVVVGSGSAGSVVANRLSEVPHWRVLLLEAGVPQTGLMDVPLFATGFQNTEYDWADLMEFQPNVATGLEANRMAWPRGRALGGTSTINYMIYTRGNRWDYDTWAVRGNPGWSYEEVLPYYIKSEKANLRTGDYRFHGRDGYLSVEDVYQSPLVRAFLEGARDLGLPSWDYNSPTASFGASTIQATTRRGRRHSAASAFLWPARKRPNLDIVTSAYVTKVLVDERSMEALGVEYEEGGRKRMVMAKMEVVLSAGTFNTPQLLMLSGIGPKEHLESLGIPCLRDSPVGRNLQDHIAFVGLSFLINATVSLSLNKVLGGVSTFVNEGTGPLTSLGGVEGIGYIKTPVSKNPLDQPDVELLFVGGTLATDYGLFTRRGMRIRDDVYNSVFAPIEGQHHWTVFPMLLHPKSVGWLELRSAHPRDRPLLQGNYFTDPDGEDVQTLVAAIRVIQQLSRTDPFARYGSRLHPRSPPSCAPLPFDSDEYWECALRALSLTLHHQVGTAKMGPLGDPTAVVDGELQVHGIGRLRVADCSVIPHALSAHTNAPAVMVGEKASDIIKRFWGEKN